MVKQNAASKNSITLNNIAAAYIRVSTKRQDEEGTSLEMQKELAVKYAKDNGLTLDENMIYREVKPASTFNTKNYIYDLNKSLQHRPQLQKLINSVHEKKFNHLIVYSRDRLARNVEEYLSIKYLFGKNNIKIHYSSSSEVFNFQSERMETFLETVLASVHEFEANIISNRVKNGNLLCIKHGYWAGGLPPFGYELKEVENTKNNSILKQVPTYAILVKKIFQLYNSGNGYRQIARLMNIEFPDILWSKSKIETIIKNPTYTGNIYWNKRGGRRNPGKHEKYEKSPFSEDICIIDTNTWTKANNLRNKKASLKNPKYYNTPFLLKDKLICEKCGKKLTTKNYGKNEKSVYRCPTKNNSKSELVIEKGKIEKEVMKKINELINTQNIDKEWDLYNEAVLKSKAEVTASIEDLTDRINGINSMQHNIEYMLKQEIDSSLRNLLEEEYLLLSKSKEYYNDYNHKLETKLKEHYFDNKDKFHETTCNLFKEHNKSNRMLIDLLIDHITVNKSEDSLSLKILFNPPQDIL